MTNSTPIDTRTLVKKVKIDGDLGTNIKNESDKQGALGRKLQAAFNLDNQTVVLIFQRTR
jgi:carbamoylphosphate synthase small subunit